MASASFLAFPSALVASSKLRIADFCASSRFFNSSDCFFSSSVGAFRASVTFLSSACSLCRSGFISGLLEFRVIGLVRGSPRRLDSGLCFVNGLLSSINGRLSFNGFLLSFLDLSACSSTALIRFSFASFLQSVRPLGGVLRRFERHRQSDKLLRNFRVVLRHRFFTLSGQGGLRISASCRGHSWRSRVQGGVVRASRRERLAVWPRGDINNWSAMVHRADVLTIRQRPDSQSAVGGTEMIRRRCHHTCQRGHRGTVACEFANRKPPSGWSPSGAAKFQMRMTLSS